jgi:hypothetical protein
MLIVVYVIWRIIYVHRNLRCSEAGDGLFELLCFLPFTLIKIQFVSSKLDGDIICYTLPSFGQLWFRKALHSLHSWIAPKFTTWFTNVGAYRFRTNICTQTLMATNTAKKKGQWGLKPLRFVSYLEFLLGTLYSWNATLFWLLTIHKLPCWFPNVGAHRLKTNICRRTWMTSNTTKQSNKDFNQVELRVNLPLPLQRLGKC